MSVFVDGQIRLRNGHGRGRLFAGTISSFQGRFLEELEVSTLDDVLSLFPFLVLKSTFQHSDRGRVFDSPIHSDASPQGHKIDESK